MLKFWTAGALLLAGLFSPSFFALSQASFNKEINYQGKLTTASSVPVANGTYHMMFRLYTVPTGGAAIWTEDRSTAAGDRVTVTNGLFSVLLGSSTSLANVDFNQVLYLGVEIGGSSGTPSWDGEMTPRKKLGAVPAAFEAQKFGGLATTSFFRTDTLNANGSSTLFTVGSTLWLSALTSGGLAVDSVGKVYKAATTTFSTGLTYAGGNVACDTASASVFGCLASADWTTFNNKLASTSLAMIYPFPLAGNATSTLTQFLNGLTAYASSTIGNGTQTGGLTIYGGATTTGSAYIAGNLGIGTTSPSAKLALTGELFIGSTGTSTITGGLTLGTAGSSPGLSVLSNATSTFAQGINLTAGCYAINGTCLSSGSGVTYPFALAGNATSTLTQFNGGLTAYASSTIGNGLQAGGLTIYGGATTTGSAYFVGNVGVGTKRPSTELEVIGDIVSKGTKWTSRSAVEANSWYSVTYGNGLFVAVSLDGTNQVMTSPDGITWTARAAAEPNGWYSVTYGNGLFVAVSYAGTNQVMTSPDGITWTARAAAQANSWNSVTYGNGLFVAVSLDGTNRVMTSPDGITWTARAAAQANSWNSVTYGNGLFVAVSLDGTNRVMTSPDGITWTARTAAQANVWNSVTYGNGLFVAVAQTGGNRVMTSPDGITWTVRIAAEANSWYSVTYGNGLFVAVAQTGTNQVMTSPDGITWTARAATEASQWQSVTYGNGLFVAVNSNGTNRVMTSGKSEFNAISTLNIYQGGVRIMGGNVGIATTSPWGLLSVNANALSAGTPQFVVGSSTATNFIVANNGNVGVGTTTPWRTLSVVGTMAVNGLTSSNTGNYVCINTTTKEITNSTSCSLSSARFKTSVEDFSLGIDALNKLRPVTFYFKPGLGQDTTKQQEGFIAEEVLQVDPLLVNYDTDGQVGGLDYPKFVVILVKAVQELAQKAEEMAHAGRSAGEKITEFFAETITAGRGVFERMTAQELVAEKLCVEDVCVTKEQFRKMVENANPHSPSPTPAPADPAPAPSPSPTPAPDTASSTPESTPSTPESSEPMIQEEVVLDPNTTESTTENTTDSPLP